MPHLTYPWALLLLLVLPFLGWQFLRHSRGVWQYSDTRLLPKLTSLRSRLARWGGLILRLSGLALAIVALSGPRWVDPERVAADGIAIAMVVDVSVSMKTEDFDWENKKISRLSGVKQIFRLFVAGGKGPDDVELKGRQNDLVMLVTFGTHPYTACSWTLEHDALLKIMDAQEPRSGANEGTTNPGDAIAWALHAIEKAPTRRKVVVFLTDGESNVPDTLKPRQAAQLAANRSIPIYAIDASPAKPEKKEAIDEAKRAREMMQTIARMTDGAYFRAQDGNGLLEAYQSIDRLERMRIESFQYRRYYEAFHWFALAALVCWLAVIALESTIWRRVP